MLRRTVISALVAVLLAGGAAEAGATQDRIVAELRDQGFSRIEIGRTLLGRVRIVATGRGVRREVVFNPSTGVILRDFWQQSGGGSSGGSIFDARRSSSGSGSGDVSDDDDDDDDDNDDGDDNSGSGSDDSDDDDDGDNSGSGSDDSDDDDDDD